MKENFKNYLAFGTIVAYLLMVYIAPIPVTAENAVSLLSEGPMAQNVVLEEVPIFQADIIAVPSLPLTDTSEVLQAQTQSVCSGLDVSSGTYVCSEFSSSTEVSDSVQGNTFSKRCEIRIIEATYPAFFSGYLVNEDARIDVLSGEASSLSDVTGIVSDVDYDSRGSIPGREYRYSNEVFKPPNSPETEYHAEGSSEVRTYAVATSGNAENVGSQSSDPITVGECPPGTILENWEAECDNLNKASNEWSEDNPWWCLPNSDCRSRPIEDDSTCPNIQLVGGVRACYEPLTRHIINIQGILSDLECLLTDNCYEDVQLMIWTDPLMGKNNGCVSPCGDMQADAQVAGTSIPNPASSCTNNSPTGIGGINAPCVEDRYVGTWGKCSVCNREVPCMFVWKNTLYDEYHRLKKERGPCVSDDGDRFCTFEEYFTHIVSVSGGSSL